MERVHGWFVGIRLLAAPAEDWHESEWDSILVTLLEKEEGWDNYDQIW